MKIFIRKILIFVAILSFVIFLIKSSVPYYWGNELMSQKLQFLKTANKTFDTFFVGSSKTYRHIDPVVFSSRTKKRAYNLGCSGMFYLEANYILDHFLDDYDAKNLVVFMQKIVPMEIADENMHSNRSKYYLDFKRFRMGFNHFWKKRDWSQVYNISVSYLENVLGIGQMSLIAEYHLNEKEELAQILKKRGGFLSLDQELYRNNSVDLKARKEAMDERVEQKIVNDGGKFKVKIKRIPEDRLEMSYDQVIHYLQIQSNRLHDSLYFDRSHLSLEGAKIFSTEVAKAYNDKYNSAIN